MSDGLEQARQIHRWIAMATERNQMLAVETALKAEDVLRTLIEEVTQLRGAIKRAGFAVMKTSGDWLICDVSKAVEEERAKTDAIILRNIELERELKEARSWYSIRDKQPELKTEVEIAIPKRYGDTLQWTRDFIRYGENVVGEPFDGFCNDNWHCDVSLVRARQENWYWRPKMSDPILPPEQVDR